MPFMLLCVTVLPFTTRVERSASNTPAPVLVSTVALRSTAAEAKPMKIPAGGPKTVWPAVELPLIVLAKGSPNPASDHGGRLSQENAPARVPADRISAY